MAFGLNAAPTVLISLANHPDAAVIDGGLVATTAGAPPSPTIIAQMEALGVDVVHVYGLTETYGPITVCEVDPAWASLDGELPEGMDRHGVIATGHGGDIKKAVEDVLKDAPERFILGADCTLPGDIHWENIKTAISAAHEYRK